MEEICESVFSFIECEGIPFHHEPWWVDGEYLGADTARVDGCVGQANAGCVR